MVKHKGLGDSGNDHYQSPSPMNNNERNDIF